MSPNPALMATMALILTEPSLLRLLQLSSLSLPVGGFAYSQGLEHAVEAGWIHDKKSARDWLALQLTESLAHVDLAILLRLCDAQDNADANALDYWNQYLLACRETAELRLTDVQMGQALVRLLSQLQISTGLQPRFEEYSFVTAFCIAACHWRIAPQAVAFGLAWSWLENQVAAATKLVPLGQTQAQELLGDLQAEIPATVTRAAVLEDDQLGSSLPALAIASSLHETQYSRLFRS